MSRPFKADLDTFFGPADLLLQVARRAEVDVATTPLATAVGQLDGHVAGNAGDLDDAAVAIRAFGALLDLKADAAIRRDRPENDGDAVEDDDLPGSDEPVDAALVERLLLYRRLRATGEFLAAAADDASRTFVRRASDRPEIATPAADRVRGLEVWDLVAAYVRATPPPETAAAAGAVRRDAVPVADVVRDLGHRVRARGPVTLGEFVGAAASRERLIATFLAVLELVRHHRFRVVQTGDAADIEVLPPADEASIAPAA